MWSEQRGYLPSDDSGSKSGGPGSKNNPCFFFFCRQRKGKCTAAAALMRWRNSVAFHCEFVRLWKASDKIFRVNFTWEWREKADPQADTSDFNSTPVRWTRRRGEWAVPKITTLKKSRETKENSISNVLYYKRSLRFRVHNAYKDAATHKGPFERLKL